MAYSDSDSDIQKAVLKAMFIFAVLFSGTSGTEMTCFSFNVTGITCLSSIMSYFINVTPDLKYITQIVLAVS